MCIALNLAGDLQNTDISNHLMIYLQAFEATNVLFYLFIFNYHLKLG